MAAADPRAPIERIGGERAHAQVLHLMMQLCSLASSTSAHMKDRLELDVEEHRRIAERHDTRTASGRVVTVGDLPRRSARGPQLVLRVGGSNGPHPVYVNELNLKRQAKRQDALVGPRRRRPRRRTAS